MCKQLNLKDNEEDEEIQIDEFELSKNLKMDQLRLRRFK